MGCKEQSNKFVLLRNIFENRAWNSPSENSCVFLSEGRRGIVKDSPNTKLAQQVKRELKANGFLRERKEKLGIRR